MKAIKVYQRPYSYTYEGGYGGDCTMTAYSADTIVEVLDIKRTFEGDEYMHKAREWVNKTFAEDEYNALQGIIKDSEREIENRKKRIKEAEARLLTFLVNVELVKK